MNTKGTEYGSIQYMKANKVWSARAWNPFLQKSIYIGQRETEEEAQQVLNDWNYKFFSENTWLLPRGISIHRTRNKYNFAISRRKKIILMGEYKTLEEAVQAKLDFINSLI